ncbi:MAG: DNA alkylation repair protein [Desulfobacteraceae bacterium]|nr:DNA alkylation repair protein [Desulfobacteraceae bacterium]MBC2756991.1 DNA alkylation repair protein [Desulfobacteraceae bacterium]
MKYSAIDIQKELRRLADKKTAVHSQRFFKTGKGEYGEGDLFLGIRVPVLRKTAGKYHDIPLTVSEDLLKSKYHEERLFALIVLVNQFKKGGSDIQKEIYRLYLKYTEFINNWDLVDISASHIVGAFLQKNNRQPLYDLAASKDLWERRISIIATFYFIRRHEFTDALQISEILLKDKEDLIHKAVGWMLREIGKRDLETEERFLKKYYLKMPRTMLRYAIEKFEEKKRLGYLKGTIKI